MTYPLLPSEGSQEVWNDPILVSIARDGTARGRRLQTGKKRIFKLQHSLITSADKSAFETFYDANRLASFSFTWSDGNTYTVVFIEGSYSFKPTVNLLWQINVSLQEV